MKRLLKGLGRLSILLIILVGFPSIIYLNVYLWDEGYYALGAILTIICIVIISYILGF